MRIWHDYWNGFISVFKLDRWSYLGVAISTTYTVAIKAAPCEENAVINLAMKNAILWYGPANVPSNPAPPANTQQISMVNRRPYLINLNEFYNKLKSINISDTFPNINDPSTHPTTVTEFTSWSKEFFVQTKSYCALLEYYQNIKWNIEILTLKRYNIKVYASHSFL